MVVDQTIDILHDVALSPNDASRKASYAHICKDASGRVYAVYRQGVEKHSYDGVSVLQYSDDHGKSWSSPVTVGNFMEDESPRSVVTTTACALPTGQIQLWHSLVDASKTDDYLFSSEGFKLERSLVTATYNPEAQATSEYMAVEPGPHSHLGVTSHPIVTEEGHLFAPYEVKNHHGAQATAAKLNDSEFVMCASDGDGILSLCDGHVAELADGRLHMLLWTFEKDTESPRNVHQIFSSDAGRTWTAPTDTGMPGQVAVPLALDRSTLIAAVNVREEPQGIRLTTSHDSGKSWDTRSAVQLYDLQSERILGTRLEQVTKERAKDGVWEELQNFTFGTPDLLLLDDGSVLMSYYATFNDVTHVRACRFKLT